MRKLSIMPLLKAREVTLATPNDNKSSLAALLNESTDLSNSEDTVLRLRQGIKTNDDAALQRKTNDPALLSRLLELERAIISKAKAKKK